MRLADPRSWSTNVREIAAAFATMCVLGSVLLFPFVFGDRTLENGASTVASLYSSGSVFPNPHRIHVPRESDPNAGALFTEPEFALEHLEIWRDGTVPLWNPYTAFGAPLAANMQAQPFSPFAWLAIAWPSPRGFNLFVLLRIVAAGFFMFLYVRRFTAFVPALGAGVSYALTGYLWLFITLPQLSVEVLTPLLLLCAEVLLREPRARSAGAFGVALAVAVAGGMPESMLLAAVFLYLYMIARVWGDAMLRGAWRRTFRFVVIGSAIAAGLSAIVTLPFLEYVRFSSNAHQHADPLLNLGSGDPFSLRALSQYIAPLVRGGPQGAYSPAATTLPRGFFGAAAAFFALLAAFAAFEEFLQRRRRTEPALFLAAVAAFLVMKRFDVPFVAWIDRLPVLRLVIFAKYEESIVACCVAALAGLGIARVRERRVHARAFWAAFVLPLLVLAGEHASDTAAVSSSLDGGVHAFAVWGALAALCLAASIAGLAFSPSKLSARTLAIGAVALVAVELPALYVGPVYYWLNPQPPASASPLYGAPYVSFLQSHLRDGERFYGQNLLLMPEWSIPFEIPDVRGLDAVYCERYLPFVRAFVPYVNVRDLDYFFVGRFPLDVATPAMRRFFALSSVRYVGVGDRLPPTPGTESLRRAFGAPGVSLYEFASPLPRVAIYHHVELEPDGPAALHALAAPNTDPLREAVAEGTSADLAALAHGPQTLVERGILERYGPRDVRARVTTKSLAFVVLNDTNFPGWTATVDGQPAAIVNANYLFRGVAVDAGTHVIDYRYRPVSFDVGFGISLASALVLLAFVAVSAFARRRKIARS